MTYKDIAGQWLGENVDYVLAPNLLTVKFDDGRLMKTLEIEKYTYDNDSARGNWLNAAGKSVVRVWQRMVPQQERR